ncbi:Cof-type HAD-IIB family hydrolase [Echinicola vietnamensis]|uniref:HAD-superfamily hydrolase, subfamily IIB n=1 Tax=Echinicola vietnamensis (strain DSM 17526 / LMG 23754 / KMM 6221) TaxID=926556 RepID=L0FZW6_ECHVK|nr:Cof-type HAD-IIB family hydrolase [Echinicola vietnamensis]AGA78170.1 HAD-superfamily hydrolase, subfamily IIB [Echinicola vietnamensis DSM 17526]
MQFKALCTDIDGTLLDKNRQISDRTLAAIAQLPADFPIILASSRMPSAMRHLQASMDRLQNPMICYNGGYIIHFNGHEEEFELLDTVKIPLDICHHIQGLAEGTAIHVSVYHEDEWYAPQDDFWTQREITSTKVTPVIKPWQQVMPDWEARNAGAHKVMCMGPAEEIDRLFKALEDQKNEALHLYRSKDTYIEIAPKAISKASALEQLLEKKYGISLSEVIAFGDNYNDIEMLQAVGYGVAVGNAREEVKAVADEVTATNKEDGVAIMIEKHLL